MSDSTPTPARDPAPRTARLWVAFARVPVILRLVAFTTAAVMAVIVGWLQSSDFQTRAIVVAERAIETALGEEATITAVNVRYWPPGLTAEGVHLFHAASGDTIVSAERIRLPVRPSWSDGIRLGAIFLQRPVVHVHFDEDGLREFRDRVRTGAGPPSRLPFTSLRIVDGTVRVDTPTGAIEVRHLETTPGRRGRTDVHADVLVEIDDFTQEAHLEWPAVALGPDAIDIPMLGLDFPAASLGGSAHVALSGALDVDLAGSIRLDTLSPLLSEPHRLGGLVEWSATAVGTTADPQADLHASVTNLEVDAPGVLTPLLSYELGSWTVDATGSKSGLEVHALTGRLADGTLTARATIDKDLVVTAGHIEGQDVSLAPLLQALDSAPHPWVDFVADATIDVTGPLAPPDLRGPFQIAVHDLTVGDRPLEDVEHTVQLALPTATGIGELHLDLDAKSLLLDVRTLTTPRNRGTARATIGLKPRGPLDLTFQLDKADLRDVGPLGGIGLHGTGTVSGHLWGPFHRLQLEGRGDLDAFEVLGIPYADRLTATIRSPDMRSLVLEGAEATVGRTSYQGGFRMGFAPPMSMRTQVRVTRGRIEDLTGLFIELNGLRGDVVGTLHLDGPLDRLEGGAHLVLSNVDLFGERFSEGVGRGFMEDGRFTLDELAVTRDDGRQRIGIAGTVGEGWALDMEAQASGLRLETLDHLTPHGLPLTGLLSADVHVGNTLDEPEPAGQIRLTDVRYLGRTVADSTVDLTTSDGVAAVDAHLVGNTGHVAGSVGLWGEQPYDLHATLDGVPLHSVLPEAVAGGPLLATTSGMLSLKGHMGPTPSPPSMVGTLSDVAVTYGSQRLQSGSPWALTATGSHVRLQGVNLRGGVNRVDLAVESTDHLYLSGDGTLDLEWLRAVVPGLERAVGTADFELQATPGNDPRSSVVVRADLIRHESAPLTFEEVDAALEFRPNKIDLTRLHASLGGGTVTGSGGVDAEKWVPQRVDLGLSVRDAQVRWLESLPAAVGSGTLSFDGPVDHLLLSGALQIDEMSFVERLDWEDWVVSFRESMLVDPSVSYQEPPMFALNVNIDADRTIRVRNNVAEATASAALRISGDTNRPGMTGSITILDGLAFFQDREFRIDRGSVQYADPFSWDPQLDISLLTDIDARDQRYRVTYDVYGPLSDWTTSTRSDPALAQADVNALLWFGVTLEELQERGELSTAVVSGVADLLATDIVLSGSVGRARDGLFIVDSIDVTTGVNLRGDYSSDPRLVVDKRLKELADIALTWEHNLVRPDEFFLSAEKRISGRWSLSGWYATLQRDRVLPIGGALGVDVSARWEIE